MAGIIPTPSCIAYWLSGHPVVSSFAWQRPSTFASSYLFLFSSVLAYLLCTLMLSLLLSRRAAPVPLGPLPFLHNLTLFTTSLCMFLGCLLSAVAETRASSWMWGSTTRSWEWLFCFPPGTRPAGRVFFWSYIFYLSKFYELLDTFVLLLKRRPLSFLHVFHHAIVVVMSFLWLEHAQSLQVIAMLTNTAVHVLMYSYYLLCSVGIRPPWKKLVTNCQIVQFVFSFTVSLALLWMHFHGEGCAGMGAWTFNAFFNASLLLLFLNFHRKQYPDRKKREAHQKKKI